MCYYGIILIFCFVSCLDIPFVVDWLLDIMYMFVYLREKHTLTHVNYALTVKT